MNKEKEIKKSYLGYYLIAIISAFLIYVFLNVIISIGKILVDLIIQYWLYLIIGILALIFIKRFLFKKQNVIVRH